MGATRAALPLGIVSSAVAVALLLFQIETASSFDGDRSRARDPGVRFGPPGAGHPLADLTPTELRFFELGLEDFNEAEDVADGVGPTMNLDGCGGCHSQPAVGGTSPAVNPQVAFAGKDGGRDVVPPFLRADGPIREARLVRKADGSPDGGVHSLFTITGRAGADGCNLTQPDFAREMANDNVIFRIPTPVFGAGLIEQIPDRTILANLSSETDRKRDMGIRGRPNRIAVSGAANHNGNDGTVARFGWKAQNQSLLLFSGEAYNVEMGITNELFQSERNETPSCQFASVPNDTQNFEAPDALSGTTAIQNFANFQRFLAPPEPSATEPGGAESIGRGKYLFGAVGCALCHTPSMKTGNSTVAALRYKTANLYSDLLVHDMGDRLTDGVTQGEAGPREFRTAPLWGLGKRIFFLHDGRTSDLAQAIREHASNGSEANKVIANYNSLSEDRKQHLLNFLRSL
jgi:CxxC motif-containing protein (DUF1111 family)